MSNGLESVTVGHNVVFVNFYFFLIMMGVLLCHHKTKITRSPHIPPQNPLQSIN